MAQEQSGTVTRTWDHYLKEAEIAPFKIQVSDDETITIKNPTGAQVNRIAQGIRAGDTQVVMLGIFGEQFERVNQLLADAPHGVTDAIIEDILEHFKFADETTLVSPTGQKVTESRPAEIQRLVQNGWQVEGTFPTSGPAGL